MTEIRKKILPSYFQAVIDGRKTFEIRLGGDGVRVGDTLILVEFDPVSGATGRKTRRRVSYVVPMDRETIDSFWSAEDVESRGLVVIGHESERQTSFTLAWRKAARLLQGRCRKLQTEARLTCTYCGGPIEGVRYCSEDCWEADGSPMEVVSDLDMEEFSVSHEGHEYHAQAMYRGEEMCQRMARVFAEALEEQAAPNYLELRMLYAPEGKPAVPLVVTVQRANGQTAHEMRAAAEVEVARLQNALAQAHTRAARWKAATRYFWRHTRSLIPKWTTNLWGRVRAEIEVERLQAALDSANATCNRIQGDGNALADQLHAWRQACQDHGIEATPEALRAALRRVDAACVADAPRCHDCGRAAERVDGRWRPRCWCVGFSDELAGADL